MPAADAPQPALLITGMHRSGTSLVASLLQSAGLDIGREMTPANHGNPRGYFENRAFLEFHEQVLAAAGLSDVGWTLEDSIPVSEERVEQAMQLLQEHASTTQPWGWKDPRTSLFLEFWRQHLPTARFLLLYRAPWEVVDSLYRRGDPFFTENPAFALTAWTHYNHKLLTFFAQFPEQCLLADLEAVLKDVPHFTQCLSQKLSISLGTPDLTLYDQQALIRPLSMPQLPLLMHRNFPEAIALYKKLGAIADLSVPAALWDEPTALARLPDWLLETWAARRQLDRVQQNLVTLQQEHQCLQQQLQLLQVKRDEAIAHIEAMETSKFWKLRKLWFRLKSRWRR